MSLDKLHDLLIFKMYVKHGIDLMMIIIALTNSRKKMVNGLQNGLTDGTNH